MTSTGAMQVWAPDGIGEVSSGDDLVAIVLGHVSLEGGDLATGDIVVVTSKAVSKAEGRVRPGPVAASLAAETQRVLASTGPIVIVKGRLGITQAMAGLDASNVAAGTHVLLPLDPDASARRLRAGLWSRAGINVGVLVSDTAGRAWRIGQTEIAIGAAGVVLTEDFLGSPDGYGQVLTRTQPCVADELCNAAELVMGKTSGRPIARIRGRADLVCAPDDSGEPARGLNRPEEQDLFGFGATEAVLRALTARSEDQPAFGAPVDVAILAAALIRVLPGKTLDWDESPPRIAVAGVDGPDELRIVQAIAFAHGWLVDHDTTPTDTRRVPLVPRTLRESP